MHPASGQDRAFRRGARIAAGLVALAVVIIMIVVVQRDHPLRWDSHLNPPAADRTNVRAGDNGPLPRAGNAPTNTSGVTHHPGPTGSDLPQP